jgi:hypothetical protein
MYCHVTGDYDVGYAKQLNNTHDFGQLMLTATMKWDMTQYVHGHFDYFGATEWPVLPLLTDKFCPATPPSGVCRILIKLLTAVSKT